jgi:small subunit ribosomal protein S2
MKDISLKTLLGVGAHFGHQVNRWNPRMQPYLYSARDGVHIFDLVKTKEGLENAGRFLKEISAKNGIILWIGTKRQAQGFVKEAAIRLSNPYIVQRWIGGLLTNFDQVRKSFTRMEDLKSQKASGALSHYTKKENLLIDREVAKKDKFFGGLAGMTKLPDVLVVIDTHREDTAVREAKRMNIPVVGILDSNADPELVSVGIPANDDAIKSLELIINYLAGAIEEGRKSSNGKPEEKKPESPEKPKSPKQPSKKPGKVNKESSVKKSSAIST